MKISFYNEKMQRVAIIEERFVSCFWSEGYNTIENFTIELQETPEYKEKVKVDYYVGRSDRKTLMVIKTVTIKDKKIVASGKQASAVLDDVAFVGTINENSKVDTAIENAYTNSSMFDGVKIVSGNIDEKYPCQISNKSFSNLCETMCQKTDVGFRSVKGDGCVNIEFYKPKIQENLVFSQKFGNLTVSAISVSTQSHKNYAIVLGEGKGENRVRVDIDNSNGETKREIIIDAKDIQKVENETEEEYAARLFARGMEKLIDCQKVFNFAFLPFEKDFGKKYDLGDVLTVLIPEYRIKLQARVVRFTQKEQNNKINTTVEVGNLIVKR